MDTKQRKINSEALSILDELDYSIMKKIALAVVREATHAYDYETLAEISQALDEAEDALARREFDEKY